MDRDWTEYETGPTVRRRDRMHVTVNARGVILLNHKAFETLGSPEAVRLLYDKRYSVIGICPSAVGSENSLALNSKGKTAHRLIYAIGFCRHFGLGFKETVAFPTPELDNNGILQLEVHKGVVTGRKR